MKQYLDLKVDLENPDEARHTIDELVKAYEADKFKWTEEEIAEAKRLAMLIMTQLCLDGYSIRWYENGCNILRSISLLLEFNDDRKENCTCSIVPSKWNLWIAKCVCLCRATAWKMPEFIIKKAGECW